MQAVLLKLGIAWQDPWEIHFAQESLPETAIQCKKKKTKEKFLFKNWQSKRANNTWRILMSRSPTWPSRPRWPRGKTGWTARAPRASRRRRRGRHRGSPARRFPGGMEAKK